MSDSAWKKKLAAARAAGNSKLAARLERDPTASEESFTITCPGCDRVLVHARKVGTPDELARWRAAHEAEAAEGLTTHAGCCRAVVRRTRDEGAKLPGFRFGQRNVSPPVVDEVEVLEDGSAIVRGAWLEGAVVRVDGREVATTGDATARALPAGTVRGLALVDLDHPEHGARDGGDSSGVARRPSAGERAVVTGRRWLGAPVLRVRGADGVERTEAEHLARVRSDAPATTNQPEAP